MSRLSPAWPVLAGDTAADALVYVTLGWLAVKTGDLSASAVLAANTAPAVLLMLLGGAVGDRLGVVKVATWTTATRALILAGFAGLVLTGAVGAGVLLVVALVLGIVDAVHQPAVYGLVAVLAERGQQRSSQALVVGITRTVGVFGAVAGGFLIGRSTELPLLVAAGSLAIAAVAAARVPRTVDVDAEPVEEPSSLLRMTREGIDAVRRDRPVMAVLVLFTLGNFAATAPLALGVPFMAEAYRWSGAQYGLVYAGFGVGQVLGGGAFVLATRRGVIDETRLGVRAAAALLLPAAACLVILSRSTSVIPAAAAIAGVGILLAPGASILIGYVRERTPSGLQGRVNGFISLSITASIPLGMLAFGFLVDLRDVAFAVAASGFALALAALAATIGSRVVSRRSSEPRRADQRPSGTPRLG